jgi:hypothetical protein
VNYQYIIAETPEERVAIAVVAAIHAYFKQHPAGVTPSRHFFAEFLKPFIEREMETRALDELHRDHAGRELELLSKVKELTSVCSKRIKG